MKLRKALFLPALVLCLLSSALFANAQSKTNVTGTWKMNAEKSKFERGGPQAIIIKFDQQGSTLTESFTMTNSGGDRTINFTYTLDGKEAAQDLGGQPIKTTARWEGESLVIEFKNDQGFNFVRKFTMAADGKTMTIDVKQTNPNGAASDTVLLEKQ